MLSPVLFSQTCDELTFEFLNNSNLPQTGTCFPSNLGLVYTLSPNVPGGIFSGPGVNGNELNIEDAVVDLGLPPVTADVTYTVEIDGAICTETISFNITAPPAFGAYIDTELAPVTEVCISTDTLWLVGSADAGTFYGTGVSTSPDVFLPQVAGTGTHEINYFSIQDGVNCETTISVTVSGIGLYSDQAGTNQINVTDLCYNGSYYVLGSPPGGTFTEPAGFVGPQVNAGDLPAGITDFVYSVDVNGEECVSTITLNIIPEIPITVNPYDSILCVYDAPITISGTPAVDGLSTICYIKECGGTGIGSATTIFDPAIFGEGCFTITYFHSDLASGCPTVDETHSIFVYVPTPLFLDFPPYTCIDQGAITLIADPPGGSFSGPGVTGDSFDPTVGPGFHEITYTYTDDLGACTDSIKMDIEVVTDEIIPDFTFTSNSACFNIPDTIKYSGEPYIDGTSLTWDIGDGVILDNQDSILVISWPEAGFYDITLEVDDNVCRSGSTMQTIEKVGLSISSPDSYSLWLGESVDLGVSVSGANSDLTYVWEPTDGLSCTDCENPTASPTENTTYTLTITDENGCTSSTEIAIELQFERNLYVPNAFTPNNDGVNDVFLVYGGAIEEFQLIIYDRWGEEVFLSNDISVGWDGEYKGEALGPGVYMFYTSVVYLNGDTDFKKGNITLIR